MSSIERISRGSPRLRDSLQTLELQIDNECCGLSDLPQLDILRRLPPSLVDLKLDLPCFSEVPDETLVPHPLSSQSLTTLELTMSSWPTHWILHCGESCPNLQTLTINLCGIDADWESVGPSYPVKQAYLLPHLHILRFRQFRDRHSTTTILRLLATPSLVELDIAFDCMRSDPEEADDMRRDPPFRAFVDDIRVFMRQSDCVETLSHARIHAVCLPWSTLESVPSDVGRCLGGMVKRPLACLAQLSPSSPSVPRGPRHGQHFRLRNRTSVRSKQKKKSQGLSRIKKLNLTMYRKPTWSHVEIDLRNPDDV